MKLTKELFLLSVLLCLANISICSTEEEICTFMEGFAEGLHNTTECISESKEICKKASDLFTDLINLIKSRGSIWEALNSGKDFMISILKGFFPCGGFKKVWNICVLLFTLVFDYENVFQEMQPYLACFWFAFFNGHLNKAAICLATILS